MKILASKTTTDAIESGLTAVQAAEMTIKILEQKVDGRGGVICLDKNGIPGFYFNTPFMARGTASETGIGLIDI